MSESAVGTRNTDVRLFRGVLFPFLGSMNLAITLLIGVAVASVVGMVIQQNQPYDDYVLQFGPFWFQVLRDLGLYNVYSAGWFVSILGFLVISTSVCVTRNTPGIIREIRDFRVGVKVKSLRLMRQHVERDVGVDAEAAMARAQRLMTNYGYRVRTAKEGDSQVLAGMKGASNRLGYLLTHVGLVVILLSGLIDGNLPLQISMALHGLKLETKNVSASQVPAQSRLHPGTMSFRGDVNLPVGSSTDAVFLRMGKGYLEQMLPFVLTLKKFTVERYPEGQPKDFVSEVVLHDPKNGKTIRAKVSDNHPLRYDGYAIYQTSFGDGGSLVRFKRWSLTDGKSEPFSGNVFNHYEVHAANGGLRVELDNFRMFNIQHAFTRDPHKPVENRGPSVTFKVRKPDGVAREYVNYFVPQKLHGRLYFVSGVRTSPAKPYRFLTIPVGPNGGVHTFMKMVSALHDKATRQQAAEHTAANVAAVLGPGGEGMNAHLASSVGRLLDDFSNGGYEAVLEDVHRDVPTGKQAAVAGAFMRVLNLAIEQLYAGVVDGGHDVAMTTKQMDWLQAALPALAVLHLYGAPFYLQPTGFHQIEASGLQVTHYPATGVAFFGSAMLMIGILLMFFVSHRQVWVRVEPRPGNEGGAKVLLAGTSNRHKREFAHHFELLDSVLFARLGVKDGSGEHMASNGKEC